MVEKFRSAIFQDRKPVFDGRKNLYTAQPLPIDKQKVSAASVTGDLIRVNDYKQTAR